MDDTQLKRDILLSRWSMRLAIVNALIVPLSQIGMWLRDGSWTPITPRTLTRLDLSAWDGEGAPAIVGNALLDAPLAILALVFGFTWWLASRAMYQASLATLRRREALERAILGH